MNDTEKYIAGKFRNYVKRQPKENFIVVTENDLDERREMQGLREAFGFTGTAYFSTLEGYH